MTESEKLLVKASDLFCDMDDAEFLRALEFYKATEKTYKEGTFLQKVGKPLPRFGIVLSGIVQVFMDDAEGNQMIMASNAEGDSFGESLAFLKIKEVPIYIKAAVDSKVLWLSMDRILAPEMGMCNHDYMNRVMTSFAKRALLMNNRIQVLSKKSLRQKLITMLSQYQQKANSKFFTVPLNRNEMSVYLGCDRSALSRELSKMKDEGIIDYYQNTFKLL